MELLGQTFPTLGNAQATAVYHVADGTVTSGSNTQLIDQTVTARAASTRSPQWAARR